MEAIKVAMVLVLLLLVVSVIGIFAVNQATEKPSSGGSTVQRQGIMIERPVLTTQAILITHSEVEGGVQNEK